MTPHKSKSKTLRFNTSRTHTSTPTTPTMTSWSKCSLPSLRVLGLTSTPKPYGTSSLETSSTKRHRLTLTTMFLTISTITLPPSLPSSATTRFPTLLSPPPPLPSISLWFLFFKFRFKYDLGLGILIVLDWIRLEWNVLDCI